MTIDNLIPKLSATGGSPKRLAHLRLLFENAVKQLAARTGNSDTARKLLIEHLIQLDFDEQASLVTALWSTPPSEAERQAIEECWPLEVRHLVEPEPVKW
jgi:hypothetical protein